MLDQKEKSIMIKYLDSFYDDFDERNSIVKYILNDCTNF
jgi:ribosomal protein S17E